MRSITYGDLAVKTLLPRLTRLAIRAYPGAWRERYEAEFLALVDDSPVTWRTVGDVLRSAGREWVRNPDTWTLGVRQFRRVLGLFMLAWLMCGFLNMVDGEGIRAPYVGPGAFSPSALIAVAWAMVEVTLIVRAPVFLISIPWRRSGRRIGEGWLRLLKLIVFFVVLTAWRVIDPSWQKGLEASFGTGYFAFLFIAAFPEDSMFTPLGSLLRV